MELVSVTHPQYDKSKRQWDRCRDVMAGSDAVKASGTKYLPKLSGQTDDEYLAYKSRANFVNLTSRAIESLLGLMTRKMPKLTYPDELQPYFKDATNTGMSFPEVFILTMREVLTTGRMTLFADRPIANGRAYLAMYSAESMINWQVDVETGELQFAVFKEQYYRLTDRFTQTLHDRYRVLSLVDGRYIVEVYEPSANSSVPTFVESVVPTNTGRSMDRIPLVSITPFGLGYNVVKPPILDMVDINLSHYRTSADLEHGRHYTALPTPVVSGSEMDMELRIGSQTAWVLPSPDAKAYFLEFNGLGLKSLETALNEKQAQIAQFSARLMDTSQRGSEASDAVKLRYAGEAASLSSISHAVEKGLNDAFNTIAEMEGFEYGSVEIELNKDFVNSKMTPAELGAWTEALEKGGVTREQYIEALMRGDMVKHS